MYHVDEYLLEMKKQSTINSKNDSLATIRVFKLSTNAVSNSKRFLKKKTMIVVLVLAVCNM